MLDIDTANKIKNKKFEIDTPAKHFKQLNLGEIPERKKKRFIFTTSNKVAQI